MTLIRHHAVEILMIFHHDKTQLKNIRHDYCTRHNITGSERQKITAITNDVIRWRGRLDYWLRSLLDNPNKKLSPKLINIFRLGLYGTIMDHGIPIHAAVHSTVELSKEFFGNGMSKFVNAILRKATTIDKAKRPKDCTMYDWFSFPQWLWEKWVKQFGMDKTIQLCEYFNSPSKMHIRRNKNKMTHEELIQYGDKNNISIELWYNSDCFYMVNKHASGLQALLNEKKIAVQDRAAGMTVELLSPQKGEIILDVCAAPGTKTNYMAEITGNIDTLYAYDNHGKRMKSIHPNVHWRLKNATKDVYPMADAVLIDAPCSGTGVIGKKPDIRWRRKLSEIKEFSDLQMEILQHMSQYVKPTGRIVYSTCSLEPEENWEVVKAFLTLKPEFHIAPDENNVQYDWLNKVGVLEPFPPESNTDGIFSVRMERN